MLVCDTSGLIAYFDRSDDHHGSVSFALDADPGPFVVSPYVLAELDHLIATRRGLAEEVAVLGEMAGGAWDLAALDAAEVRRAADVIGRYPHQNMGLADASLVVLAGRYGTDRILTVDQRHFRVLRTLSGRAFDLVPHP